MKKQTTHGTKPLLLTLLSSGLLVIYSCNFEVLKKGPVEKAPPAGHILEYGTNAPIPNALVYIQECESQSLGNISCQQIDTVFSDADGYYQFQAL
jgi:hypothetical protein